MDVVYTKEEYWWVNNLEQRLCSISIPNYGSINSFIFYWSAIFRKKFFSTFIIMWLSAWWHQWEDFLPKLTKHQERNLTFSPSLFPAISVDVWKEKIEIPGMILWFHGFLLNCKCKFDCKMCGFKKRAIGHKL